MSDAPSTDLDAEQAVLGAVLLGAENVIAGLIEERLHPGDFYRAAHSRIYKAMLAMHDDGEPIDRLTLRDRLHREGALEEVGGRAAIDLLSGAVPAAGNFRTYARVLLRLSMWRARRTMAYRALERIGLEDEQGYRDVLASLRRCELHYRPLTSREVVTP